MVKTAFAMADVFPDENGKPVFARKDEAAAGVCGAGDGGEQSWARPSGKLGARKEVTPPPHLRDRAHQVLPPACLSATSGPKWRTNSRSTLVIPAKGSLIRWLNRRVRPTCQLEPDPVLSLLHYGSASRPDPLPRHLVHEPTRQTRSERRIRPRAQSEGVRLLLGLWRSQPRLPGCWNGRGVRPRLGF